MLNKFMLANRTISAPLPRGSSIQSMKMLHCDGKDQVARCVAKDGWNAFEPPMPDLFFKLAQSIEGIVLDIGANTGFYSIIGAAARHKLHTWAFEPDPHVRPILKKNLELNGIAKRVTVFPLALSDNQGSATLYIPTQEHGLVETSSSLEKSFKTAHSATIVVPVSTVDLVVSDNRSAFVNIAIIKIDVEGHEAAVLRGAEMTIKEYRPILFVEVLPRAELDFLDGFLKQFSYKDVRLRPNGMTQPDDVVVYDEQAWNHVFVPSEKTHLIQ